MNCKLIFLFFALAAGLSTPFAGAQAKCAAPALRSHVELEGDTLFLSDLFLNSSCPVVASGAVRIRLGAAPLAGSPRIITKDEILAILYKYQLADGLNAPDWNPAMIPQRITIERMGRSVHGRADLPGIRELSADLHPHRQSPEEFHSGEAVTLLWDDGGIQSRSPAVCLDRGSLGQRLRVRVPGGRIVHAIAMTSRELRVVS